MRQFAAVVRELRAWFLQMPFARALFPFRLILLYLGVSVQLARKLLYEIAPSSAHDELHGLFYGFPLDLIAYYAFFVGFWLTLASRDVRFMPPAAWAYAFAALFPFGSAGVAECARAILYVAIGFALRRYASSPYGSREKRTTIY